MGPLVDGDLLPSAACLLPGLFEDGDEKFLTAFSFNPHFIEGDKNLDGQSDAQESPSDDYRIGKKGLVFRKPP